MATIKHDHMTVILENLPAINVMNSSAVRQNSWTNCRRKVDSPEPTYIVEFVAAEYLCRIVAVYLIDICTENGWDLRFDRSTGELHASIVGDAYGLPLYCPPDVFRNARLTLRVLLARRLIHVSEEVLEKEKRKKN